ncbi:MAG: DUF6036 family nucleotidyltransferase [bacterium]
MREVADSDRIVRFMRAFGGEARDPVRVYFTGGATAVLFGWRASTIDIDIKVDPDDDRVLRILPHLKELLKTNVELASPADFIPVRPGWEERSPFIAQVDKVSFYHFDLYAQALAKVERSHAQDVEDIREMVARGLIDPAAAIRYFNAIEPELYRYPAIDPKSFRRAVEETFGSESALP